MRRSCRPPPSPKGFRKLFLVGVSHSKLRLYRKIMILSGGFSLHIEMGWPRPPPVGWEPSPPPPCGLGGLPARPCGCAAPPAPPAVGVGVGVGCPRFQFIMRNTC